MKDESGKFISVDISKIESKNLGVLGRNRHYEKVETNATYWIADEKEFVQIEIETKAWSKGKRYRAVEPLIINRDGRVLWR